MSKERLRLEDYLLIALLLVLFVGLSIFYNMDQVFSFDQTQMLLKGIHADVTGEYLPFGNEASTMGNVPGFLSSWLIGFPLKIVASAWSVVIFQFLLRVAGILLFVNALCMLFGRKIVLIGTFLLSLSPWVLYQTMLFNPAYLLFGSTLALNALVRLRNEQSRSYARMSHGNRMHLSFDLGRFCSSMILVLAIGYCMQLHFSWTVLAALAGIMYLRRDIKISYAGVIVGLLIVAYSLVPYVQEVMANPRLLTNPEPYAQDRYLGYGLLHVYPIFKGLLYWFRFGSLLVTEKAIMPELGDDLSLVVVILGYAWIGIASLIGGLSVIYAAYSNYFVISRFHVSNSSSQLRFVRGLTISGILAVMLAAAASPVILNFAQVAILIPFALLPVLAFMSVRAQGLKLLLWIAAIFFVFANALGAGYSDKFNYQQHFTANFYKTCLQGFSPQQCALYCEDLSPEQQQLLAEQTHYSKVIVERVIEGKIPHYIEVAIELAYYDALKIACEVADAIENQPASPDAAQVQETSAAEPQEKSITEESAAPAASSADAAAAAASVAASSSSSSASAAAAHKSSLVVAVQPANAPLLLESAPAPSVIAAPAEPASPSSDAAGSATDSKQSSAPESKGSGVIIDKGQGISGELVIH